MNNLQTQGILARSRNDITVAILLLVLAMSGGYLAQTFSCQVQYLFTNNIYIKHILIFFVIYFSIGFTRLDDIEVNPIINIFRACLVWILFHLYSRMNIIPTLIILFLLMVLYIIYKYRIYYESKLKNISDKSEKDDYINRINMLDNGGEILGYVMLIITIVGFFMYYIQKKQDFKGRFSLNKFIFGIKTCKSMK